MLQANATKFGKQTTQWLKLVDQFNTALKEIGDVRNWAATIESDLVHVCEVLEKVQREQPNAVQPAAAAAAGPVVVATIDKAQTTTTKKSQENDVEQADESNNNNSNNNSSSASAAESAETTADQK